MLGELASAGPGPEGGPDAAIARAAAFTLGRHGLGVPDTPEARTCALLGRVAGSRASEEDARTLAADWSTALGVADVCLNELTDDIPDPSLPMWLGRRPATGRDGTHRPARRRRWSEHGGYRGPHRGGSQVARGHTAGP